MKLKKTGTCALSCFFILILLLILLYAALLILTYSLQFVLFFLSSLCFTMHHQSLEFKKTGRSVMRKYWCNNNRCFIRFLIIVISFVTLISLAVGLTKRFRTHDLTSAVSITNVTTEPLFNVSSSFMQTQITPSAIDRIRTGLPPDRRG